MCRRIAFRSVLLLAIVTTTRGQYFDLFQGIQQFLQPYQQNNDFFSQAYDVTRRPSTHRQTNRHENKKKNEENGGSHLRKPPTSQFDTTTFKTNKKSNSKPNSSHNNSNNDKNSSINYRYQPSLIFNDNFTPNYDNNRPKNKKITTTTVNYNNRDAYLNTRTTTSKPFSNNRETSKKENFEIIPSVTENVYENYNKKQNYGTYETQGSIYDNQNRRTIQNDNYNNYQSVTPNNIRNQNNQVTSRREFGNYNREYSTTSYPNYQQNSWSNSNNFGSSFGNQNYNNRGNQGGFGSSSSSNINRGTSTNNNRGILNTDSYWNTNTNSNKPTPNNFNNNRQNSDGRWNTNDNRWNTNVNSNNNRPSSNNRPNIPGVVTFPDSPLINRPGVKPAPVPVGAPPITNRPVTENPFGYRPSGSGNEEVEPQILIGPDEDDMSDTQKRRYIDMIERMCDRYKSLNVKKVVALPLVPSPSPLEVNITECTPLNVPLVIGGTVTTIDEFPHMALVGWKKTATPGYSWKCGGSLISEQYILTAGHCTYQDKDYDTISGPPQAVQLGSSYLDDPGALVVKVAAVIRHPKYKQRRSYHDVAMIKMVTKVKFSEVVRPACIGVPPPVGRNIIATGWGRTEFGGDHSLELRSVSLPIWDMRSCREIWGTSLKLPQGVAADSHVCAGDKRGGKDTCQGDSGGPAQIEDGCAWRVVAVTSFGRSCGAPGTPALYAVIPRAFVAKQIFDNTY